MAMEVKLDLSAYVDDLINGFLSMMDHDENFSGPINLGNQRNNYV